MKILMAYVGSFAVALAMATVVTLAMGDAVAQDAGPAIAAAPILDPAGDTGGFCEMLLDTARDGKWFLALSLLLVGAVELVKRFGKKWIPWLDTDRGGVFLVVVGSFLGAIATSALAGQPPTLALLFDAIKVTGGAVLTYVGAKKALKPAPAPEPAKS